MRFLKNKHAGHLVIILLIASIFVFVGTTLAVNNIDDLNKEINKQQPENVESPSLILNVFKLVLVMGVIIAAAWSVIQLFGKQANAKMQGTWLHVVDEVMLGQNRGIVLCEIDGKLYALGVTDGQINLLFEIDNPSLIDEIGEGEYGFNQNNTSSFMSLIYDKIGRLFRTSNSLSGEKGFHLMMQEQSQKIKGISLQNRQDRGSGVKKNGEEKQV